MNAAEWISIIALLFSGAALFLTYWAKLHPYHHIVYAKQVETYGEMASLLAEMMYQVNAFVAAHTAESSPERKLQIIKDCNKLLLKDYQNYTKRMLVIPYAIEHTHEKALKACDAVFASVSNQLDDAACKNVESLQKEMRHAVEAFIDDVRKQIHSDAITKDVTKTLAYNRDIWNITLPD